MTIKSKELTRNTIVIGFGRLSFQTATFILLPLYTAYLSPTEYGVVDLLITYTALLIPVLTIQLEQAAFRFLIDSRSSYDAKRNVISNIMQIVGMITIVLAIGCITLSLFVDVRYLGLFALLACTTIYSNLFLQIARGMGDNKRYAVANMLMALALIVSAVIFVVIFQLAVNGVLLALSIATLTSAIYLFISLKLHMFINFKNNDMLLKKQLIRYSWPLVPNGVSWWIINASDRTVISLFLGLAANGIYAIANRYALIFYSMSAIFGIAWTESASVHINSKDRNQYFSQVFNTSLRLFGSLGVVLIAVAPIFFALFIDQSFSSAALYIPILILAALFNLIVMLYSAIYIAKKMSRQVANTSLVAAAINIGLNVLLIPFIGIYAAAISTAVAYLFMAIYRHYDLKKFLTIRYEKSLFIKLTVVYAVVVALYYTEYQHAVSINILLACSLAVILNISTIGVMRRMQNERKTRRIVKL